MERFCTQGSISENKALVEQLQHYGILKSKKVAEVMEIIDRGLFVPEGNPAYLDSPMPIGYNATISAPHMHATCLELLEGHLQPGMRALDVGSDTLDKPRKRKIPAAELLLDAKKRMLDGFGNISPRVSCSNTVSQYGDMGGLLDDPSPAIVTVAGRDHVRTYVRRRRGMPSEVQISSHIRAS